VLKHQGYPAGAVVRITPLKDRALGIADATIVIDRAGWLALTQRQRDALVDHELTHLVRKVDKDAGELVCDVLDRPKLLMRKHDRFFGWFDEVAQRHGEASTEVMQARRLVESSGQLYFDFEPRSQEPNRSQFGGLNKNGEGDGTLKDGTKFTVKRTPTKAKRTRKPTQERAGLNS
jgi:hypothetical protein